MAAELIGVSFEPGEFDRHFPEIAKRGDLNKSDKVRLALGLEPRRSAGGAPKGNQYAVGNKGRWGSTQIGWGQYIDDLVDRTATEEGVQFIDYGRDFILNPKGRWAQRRDLNTKRFFFFDSVENHAEIRFSQMKFDEEDFVSSLREIFTTLRSRA